MSSPQAEDVYSRVEHVLRTNIGPALRLDGDGIEVLEVTDGIARIRIDNVCNGCPSTIMTVIMEIEQELCRLIPEIDYIEAVY